MYWEAFTLGFVLLITNEWAIPLMLMTISAKMVPIKSWWLAPWNRVRRPLPATTSSSLIQAIIRIPTISMPRKNHFCQNSNLSSLNALKWLCTAVVVPDIAEYFTTTQWECCLQQNVCFIGFSISSMTHFWPSHFCQNSNSMTSIYALKWLCPAVVVPFITE